MRGPKKATKKSPPKAATPSTRKVVDGEMTANRTPPPAQDSPAPLLHVDGQMPLPPCNLKQALDSLYGKFASMLAGQILPRSTKLFEEDIPGMVYDVAVGAGWLPPPPEEETAGNTSRLHGKQLVFLGDGMVERWYKDSFMAVLEDSIAFHTDPPDTRQRRIDSLPKYTSKEERQALLDEYIRREVAQKSEREDLDPMTKTTTPKMTQVAEDAGVDYSDFNKWRRGPDKMKDSSEKAKRIGLLLVYSVVSRTTKPLRGANTK
ncbi:MAG: hypothetical protein LC114_04275 [Bryobacterales bacterium]|nr:hypothetical protein [Bryobacterales bacterium]